MFLLPVKKGNYLIFVIHTPRNKKFIILNVQ